ncbi:MAG: superoxide dismutase family protein [Thermoanaerobaculia bacterium]
MKVRPIIGLGFAAACALLLTGAAPSPKASEGPQAKASIEGRSGSTATGTATFTELATGGVAVHVHIEKAPAGTHGLHIHEKGDCSDPEAKSAGGHFNPGGMPHAGPKDAMRHAGDLGNIEIRADGTGDLKIVSDMLTVKPGPNSVIGRSVVFHEKADDMTTQPTGNAGGRWGCGVIQ